MGATKGSQRGPCSHLTVELPRGISLAVAIEVMTNTTADFGVSLAARTLKF